MAIAVALVIFCFVLNFCCCLLSRERESAELDTSFLMVGGAFWLINPEKLRQTMRGSRFHCNRKAHASQIGRGHFTQRARRCADAVTVSGCSLVQFQVLFSFSFLKWLEHFPLVLQGTLCMSLRHLSSVIFRSIFSCWELVTRLILITLIFDQR